MSIFQSVPVSKEKPAFVSVYTDSCCTEGHVKRNTAYFGHICLFVCNLSPYIKNSMSELGSWSCRGTSSWVVGQMYRRSILRIGHFSVSNFVRSSTASICQEVYEFWTASPLSLYRRSADCSI